MRNAGAGEAAATTLRYYRSTDATITTDDTQVGTDEVAKLAASATSGESVDLTAPSTPGPYYYGACADAVTGESDTTNNCSGSVQVTVPAPKPDLMVGSPTVDESNPAAGAAFTLSATVRNAGAGEAATTLRYYRSTDATITTDDTEVGTDEVAKLAASATSGESVELTAPATPGPYYYGACVDAVTDESDTTNNCSGSVQVTVPAPKPDLVVGSPTVDESSPAAGAAFTLSATVRNAGAGEAEATTLRYYRSTDATITTDDTEVGTDEVAKLAASATSGESVELTAPATPGPYYYGACADAVTDESDTTNNCSGSVQVTVPAPKPDLMVGSPTVDESSPAAGAAFTLSATVRNAGAGEAEATTLRYYRSTDATITTSDIEVGTDEVAKLAASATSGESVDLTAPATPGPYHYGACVDAVTGESDTTNNCSGSVQVTVPAPKPDLMVGSPTVDESSPAAGAAFTLSVTVENDGGGAAAATTLRYYRSTDATITADDTQVGTDEVAKLAASATSGESVDLTAPTTPGPYYYGACVDAVTDESDTTNNCSGSVQVTVPAPKPDLMVGSPTVDKNSPVAGAAFTLSVTVENDGDGAAAATTLRYYRSTDATITTDDTEAGTDSIDGLAAAGTSSRSVALTAPETSGTYYYGACVDAVTGESDTANNCSTSVQVTVPAAQPQVRVPAQPDLLVTGASVSDWVPGVGEQFTLSATVRNAGDAASAAATLRYRRSRSGDNTATPVGTDAVAALGRFETQPRVGGRDRTVAPWDVPLPGLRGRGRERVRHDQQLRKSRAGHGGGQARGQGRAHAGFGELRQDRRHRAPDDTRPGHRRRRNAAHLPGLVLGGSDRGNGIPRALRVREYDLRRGDRGRDHHGRSDRERRRDREGQGDRDPDRATRGGLAAFVDLHGARRLQDGDRACSGRGRRGGRRCVLQLVRPYLSGHYSQSRARGRRPAGHGE